MTKGKENYSSFFGRKSIVDEGWNIPPDFVFDNAMKEIDKKKKRRKGLIILLGLLLLSSSVLYTTYIIKSDDKIAEAEESKVVDVATNSSTVDKRIEESLTGSSTTKIPINDQIIDGEKPNLTKQKQSINKEIKGNSYSKVDLNKSEDKGQENQTSQKNHTNQKDQIGLRIPFITKLPINLLTKAEDIPLRPQLIINRLRKDDCLVESYQDEILLAYDDINAKKQKSSIGVFTNYFSTSFSMGNIDENTPPLKEYDNDYGSYGFGIEYQKPITKFVSVVGSVSYRNFKNRSTIMDFNEYDPSAVSLNANGEMVYQSDMDIETPVGSVLARAFIPIMEEPDRSEKMVSCDSKIAQKFEAVSVGTGVRLNWLRFNKFSIGTDLLLNYNYIFSEQTTINSILKMDSSIEAKVEFSNISPQAINSSFLSTKAALNLGYLINDKWQIGVNIGYNRSITSLRSNQENYNLNTHAHQWNSRLGLFYMF